MKTNETSSLRPRSEEMAKEESHSVLAAFRVHKKHEDPADQSAMGYLIPVVMEATKRMSHPEFTTRWFHSAGV